ncbi:MAG TPA: toll/interleukin-1 receptor domain-containing protein, partial [Ilumatobacteraceae bacterium]
MTLFLSYAHQDLDVVTSLRRDLEDLGQTVWLDESLHGGQIWWEEILRQVRQCNGFVLAVSARSLDSEACLAEWEYAVDLARTFLPVRIDATEWTAAPDRMRQSQHIDYTPNDVESVKALVKSLGGFSPTVPLPEVMPTPPPTPLSYHERYAKLFGPTVLTFDDQINYFARLTTDIDSANAKEALELLTVLRNREDLTVKMGKRIDEYLAQRNISIPTTSAPVVPPDVLAAVEDDVPEQATGPGATLPPPDVEPATKKNRLPLILAVAAGAAVVAGILIFVLRPKSHDDATPRVENTECDAYNCSEPPIQFLDIAGDPQAIKVTITDPVGGTRDADPPTPYGEGLEWHWSADSSDPIGDYTVHFAGTNGGPVDHTFKVN